MLSNDISQPRTNAECSRGLKILSTNFGVVSSNLRPVVRFFFGCRTNCDHFKWLQKLTILNTSGEFIFKEIFNVDVV